MHVFNVFLLVVVGLVVVFLDVHPPTYERLKQSVAIETRSLALFRVLVGVLIVADVLLRARNFTVFYTDAGVVPRSLALALLPDQAFSVFLVSAPPTVTALLFALHLLVGIQLLVGYRTRLATVLAFLFVVSLDHRNPLVLSYADTLFRLLLFWAVFLPLGERWSVDALLAKTPPRRSIASLASGLILLQMVFMYFVNATHKAESAAWRNGEALVLVLGLDDMTFLLGDLFRPAPTVLQLGGMTWYYLVWLSPLLLLATGRIRTIFALLFVVAHLVLAVSVRIGVFSFVAIAGVLLFLQADFWAIVDEVMERLDLSTLPMSERVARLGRFEGPTLPTLPTAAGIPSDRLRDVGSVLLLAVLLTAGGSMTVQNLQTAGIVHEDHDLLVQEEIETVNAVFDIDQPSWAIFAPEPRTTDYYYVFPAETTGGELVDAYNGREMTYARPYRALNRQYPTYRYRFYMNSIRRSAIEGNDADAHRYLATYYCENWRTPDGDRLRLLNAYAIEETVTLQTVDNPSRRERHATYLFRHACNDGDVPQFIRVPPPDLLR